MLNTPQFEINQWGPGYIDSLGVSLSYQLIFKEPRPKGEISIRFKPLERLIYYTLPDGTKPANLLLEQGLTSESNIGQITSFQPNGIKLTPEELEIYSRQGVGSKILPKVIDDCLKINTQALYIVTPKISMKNFARKNNSQNYP